MIHFRFYCLDERGRILNRCDLEARDDEDAIRLVSATEPASDREIWQGTRKVTVVPRQG